MNRALLAVVVAILGPALVLPRTSASGQASAPGQVTPARPPTQGAEAAKGTAVIKGTVVAMDTGAPLRRVQLRAFGTTPAAGGTRVTTTDDQGRFELRELAAGRYTINASKSGFVSLQYGQRRPSERGTPVEVADGETVEKVTIALPRGGVITGRITTTSANRWPASRCRRCATCSRRGDGACCPWVKAIAPTIPGRIASSAWRRATITCRRRPTGWG